MPSRNAYFKNQPENRYGLVSEGSGEMDRTNPLHYMIRFLVFMVATMLVIGLIIAGCTNKPSTEDRGAPPKNELVRHEDGYRFQNGCHPTAAYKTGEE
jgi:hypothetical protein